MENPKGWDFDKLYLVNVGHEADVKEVSVIQGQILPGTDGPVLALRLPLVGPAPQLRQEFDFKIDTGAVPTTLKNQDIANLNLQKTGDGRYSGRL